MKKHLFLKSLLIAIGLLITSLTTQMWAAWYVRGDSPLSWDNGASMTQSSANSAVYYLQVSGSRTFKIVNAYSGWDCTIIGAGNKASDNTYGNVSLTGSDNISSTQTGTWYICYHATDDKIYGTTTNPEYPDMVIAGDNWGDPAIGDWSTTATQMTNNGDGTYSKTITGVTTTAHQFKITYKGTWTGAKGYGAKKVSGVNCTPSDNGGNIQFTPAAAGDVTITYNQSTGNIVITCPSPSVTINLNNQGGSSSPSSVTANLSSPMPTLASTPTYAGKKFEGYYTAANGGGTQYYYYNGTSAHTCDLANNSTLYANWKTPATVTLYYAVSAATVADNTVQVNINYGYDQRWIATNMSKTDKTYNGKVIYSVEVTANYESFDNIYFWPKGSSTDQEEACSSYTASSSINGKMFVQGSSAGTWITYAEDEPYTLYFVNTGDWTKPCGYAWSSEADKSCAYDSSEPMTNTGFTYAGKDIYSITYSKGYDKVIFNNNSSSSEGQKTGDLDCYSNRGQIYNGSGWHAYGRDIYIYAIPEDTHYGYETAFDPAIHELRANVKVGSTGDGEWLGVWPIFSKTSFKYNGHWIYVARVLAKYNVICQIQFWEYSGGSAVSGDSFYNCNPGSEYAASDINGKIFGGWVDETHKWYDFGWDVALDRQGGTTGSESITATQGAAMPDITAPGGKTGYSFGGYFTEEGGSGTQYYAANGSSAANWDESDVTTLFAKWTQSVVLDKENGDSNGSVTLTYNSNTHGEITNPNRVGYTFAGWYTGDDGSGTLVINTSGELQASVSGYTGAEGIWTYDGSAPTLHAKWTPVPLTTKSAGNWNVAANWNPECVPTKDHDVTIAHAITVVENEEAKSVTINQSTGSLVISSSATLDVIGTISNTNEERLEVMAGGALIFDYSSAPAAKVHHSVTGGTYRYIALPISYVHVSSAFSGKDVYTFVWNEGTGWERRGYYDDISGNEPIAISGQSSWTFYGTLVNALFGSVAYTSGDFAGTNMYANSWTAPIRISGVSISGNADQTVYIDNSGSWFAVTAGDPGSAVIPAMSSFVILANAGGGSVSIPYNTAVRNVTASSPSLAPKRVASDDLRDHITMNITGNELKTNLRLYENEQFTNEFDNGWEARFLEGDGRAGQLYSQTDDKMVVLATPDLEGTVVGFIPGEATNYTISFEGDGRGYYLNDVKEEEATLIEEGNTYVFTPDESTNSTRFVISKTPIKKTPTSVENINDGVKARKQMIDGTLYIIRDGRIYNAEGSLVK